MNVKSEIWSVLESNPEKYIKSEGVTLTRCSVSKLYTLTKAGAARIIEIIPNQFPSLDWKYTIEEHPDNEGGTLFICWISPEDLNIECMSFTYREI